jgi:NAD-dependent DNA ligase
MEKDKVEQLRIAVNQFYMNKYLDEYPTMSDEVFDALRAEYESEGASVKDLVEWDAEKRENTLPIGLNKVIVGDNDLVKFATNWIKERASKRGYTPDEPNPYDYIGGYFNYKYDGCSILGIYHNGRLKEVRSTPDEAFGIVRTKAFINIFPECIEDKEVIALQGEALVDYRAYGQLARNKANGLVNSIYKDNEVKNEIFVRIYKVYYKPEVEESLTTAARFYRQIRTLDHLPRITKVRTRLNEQGTMQEFDDVVFSSAYRFNHTNPPSTPLVTEQTTGCHFQVDGIVAYTEEETLAMKFYFTEYAITTVTNIAWNIQGNGGWAPKVQFEPVVLNDKNISQAASGGAPNMLSMKFGIGAKIKVILANMTIPKIIEVLEPSENYNWPTCDCRYQISEKDIFGSSVKCQSHHCERRTKQWLTNLDDYYNTLVQEGKSQGNHKEFLKDHIFDCINLSINIDRWNAEGKLNRNDYTEQLVKDELIRVIESNNPEEFKTFITRYFYLSGLQQANMEANYGPGFEALVRFMN